MRVWIENPFDNLPLEGFRPQRYWLMAEAFARAGNEVVLWTADFNHTTKRRREILRRPSVEADGFQVVFVHEPPYGGNVSIGRICAHLRYAAAWRRAATARAAERGGPDVIIVSSPPLGTGSAARSLARMSGARLVVDVMDAWPETFRRVAPSWALLPLGLMAKRNYLGADMVTTVADRYSDVVRGYGYSGEIHRFYHGIETGSAPVPRSAAPGRMRLAYIGSLGRTYDLATVIAALAAMPGASLDIAGRGEQESALVELARRTGVADRVRFRGYLGESDMAALLAECDAGIVPMSADSFVGVPYKFCDYAKAGLAILSSLAGESADMLVRSGAGAVYRPSDPADFARAAASLDVAAAGNAARRMAERVFDARTIYDGYVECVTSRFATPARCGKI